jgi:hypothetical protein
MSSVSSLEGDASIAIARGKRKNIYDFTVVMDWKVYFSVYTYYILYIILPKYVCVYVSVLLYVKLVTHFGTGCSVL